MIMLVNLISNLMAEKVVCENITNLDDFRKLKKCSMEETTAISSKGFTISSPKDYSIQKLSFLNNKKVWFLPENVDENFPNLLFYDAGFCSIKMITKPNFKGLENLTKLFLQQNEITEILKNVFEDLLNLELLDLSE